MRDAALSLDLDNKWSYMKTHGDPGWESFPSYLDIVVPRFLQFLGERGLRITVFIVGQDAALERNVPVLRSIAEAGHEIGNHSFHHEPWLHTRSKDEIEEEIAHAESCIEAATGQRPVGFRGPGFTRSTTILEVLARRGYAYDASTLPTWIGPLARAYYFRSTHLDEHSRQEREGLFGAFTDGFEANRFHRVRTPEGEIAEVPVTTMPIFRVPIHVSYVLYLSAVSPALARRYVRFAVGLCRLTGTEPSILLHPLDFLGGEDCPELAFFPAMQMRAAEKLAVVDDACRVLSDGFTVKPLLDFVNARVTPTARAAAPAPGTRSPADLRP
ncbi:MAG TPA: polysaccharide deacetylase family protein [Candidatus Dormibacteraeota bacterium]|nr:polysaccharide deacetylase family protein [Candidatus Dormibacteraeota bacterium]